MIKDRIKHEVGIRVARHRRSPVLRGLAHACRSYLEMDGNRNYEFADNGEAWLLHQIGETAPRVVFDVGANVGDWTAQARRVAPAAEVHAFELIPATAQKLTSRYHHDPRITVVASGLSDEEGTLPVKYYAGHSTVSSIADYPHPYPHEWIDATVVRGEDYCAAHGIDQIDYLKVDAEGSDHRVLSGFADMLKAGSIAAIQFEYGRANIGARFLLADYHDLLEGAGYVVGKLYPNHVDFRPYDIDRDEDFLGPNIVAVRAERKDLLALLS